MKKLILGIGALLTIGASAQEFDITNVHVKKDVKLQQLIFTMEVESNAGDSIPTAIGMLDGAPVLGYVFPTTLSPTDVGFGDTEGILAMALTSHPDFDDTPLWDENMDADYANDGVVWHAHWVVLENNMDVPGGLAVKATVDESILPPTNPGMPMYMDSPGFQVTWNDQEIQCAIPLYRMNNQDDFNYDGVTAYMQVNTSDPDLPMLGVYDVYEVASGDLSLPYSVGVHSCDTIYVDLATSGTIGLIDPITLAIYPNPASDHFTIDAPLEMDLDQFEIQVYTMAGALVLTKDLEAYSTLVEASEVGGAGAYIINFVDKGTGQTKAVKQLILQD